MSIYLHHLGESRFANARLPAQHHNVAPTRLDLCPALPQEPHFVLTAHQQRETAGDRDVEALLHLSDTYDLVNLERRGHAFEVLVPKRLAGEIALDEALCHRADDDGIGCRQPLEAGSNVRCISQG